MKTIQPNSKLTVRFITDCELRPEIQVIERKGNFAILKLAENEIVKRKIFTDGEKEYVFPYGKYSMCPIAY
jgi:hypothetical protein